MQFYEDLSRENLVIKLGICSWLFSRDHEPQKKRRNMSDEATNMGLCHGDISRYIPYEPLSEN
jgi:hypothetical protein